MLTMMTLNEDFVNLPAFHQTVLNHYLLVHLTFSFLQSCLKLHYYKFHQQNILLHIVLSVRLPRCSHITCDVGSTSSNISGNNSC